MKTASRFHITGKSEGLHWCQLHSTPWHPLHHGNETVCYNGAHTHTHTHTHTRVRDFPKVFSSESLTFQFSTPFQLTTGQPAHLKPCFPAGLRAPCQSPGLKILVDWERTKNLCHALQWFIDVYSNSQRDSENVTSGMIIIVLD